MYISTVLLNNHKEALRMKMREIADAAGVSLTTVSLVLNGKPGIGDEKRALVTRLLQENGYQIRPEDAPQRIHAHSNLCFLKYSKHSLSLIHI